MTMRGTQRWKQTSHPRGGPEHIQREPFDVHVFLREIKIVVVDLGGIAILVIWLWHEAVFALAAH